MILYIEPCVKFVHAMHCALHGDLVVVVKEPLRASVTVLFILSFWRFEQVSFGCVVGNVNAELGPYSSFHVPIL